MRQISTRVNEAGRMATGANLKKYAMLARGMVRTWFRAHASFGDHDVCRTNRFHEVDLVEDIPCRCF
jgi:hypothetical protein